MAEPAGVTTPGGVGRLAGPDARPLRVAHLTTVDMSLALLLGTELQVDVSAGCQTFGISAPGRFVPEIEGLGVRHVAVPSLTRAWDPRRDLAAVRELARVLRRLRPDVLHTHNPKTGVIGRVLGRALGVPVVVNTCHGLWASADDRWRRRLPVYAAEVAASYFSGAELYQNATDLATLRRWLWGRDLRVVGNGVDLARFGPSPEARARARAEIGVDDDTVLVGGVGRLVAEKGIREFAAVARRLAGTATFCWAGPEDRDKADALSADLDGVRFLGEWRDMPALYNAYDVFVLPSYREGFSRSAMEAAACGTAMVLSDIRGCREIGQDGREVVLVPPRDPEALGAAVGRLVADPEERDRLGQAACTRARAEFDQRRIARASLEAYVDVARRQGLDWRLVDETAR